MVSNIELMEMVIVLFLNDVVDNDEKEDFLNIIQHKIDREELKKGGRK